MFWIVVLIIISFYSILPIVFQVMNPCRCIRCTLLLFVAVDKSILKSICSLVTRMKANVLFIHCPTVLISVVVTADQLRLSNPTRSTDLIVCKGIT